MPTPLAPDLWQLLTVAFSLGGAYVMVRRAVKDVEGLREDLKSTNGMILKVSLQVAYLNGQLAMRGIVAGPMPDEFKIGKT